MIKLFEMPVRIVSNVGPAFIQSSVFATVLASAIVLTGCSSTSTRSTADSDSTHITATDHADRDIAMTVRSVIDTFRVGEPLDSAEYQFEGVLTDGAGRPLYTDVQGAPGLWQVKVHGDTAVSIRNIYLGDLLPDDLEQYVTAGVGLPQDAHLYTANMPEDDTRLSVYSFNGGNLLFQTRTSETEGGAQGTLLTIFLQKAADKK